MNIQTLDDVPRTLGKEGSTRLRQNPPLKQKIKCCLKNHTDPEDSDQEHPQDEDTPPHYQDIADQLTAQDFPQHLQVYTGLSCAECGAPTIWRVDLWRTSFLEWYKKTIRDAELGIRLAFKDAPRICPNEACRLATNRRKGQKTQQDLSIREHLKRPVVVAIRKAVLAAKRRWTRCTKEEQRRQQVLDARQNDVRVFSTKKGGSCILSNEGWDSLYFSGLNQAQSRMDVAIQTGVPPCHTLPLSDKGTRHDSEDLALEWLNAQPLPLVAIAAEPLNSMCSRLTLSGLHTRKVDDVVASYHPTKDAEVFTDVLFIQVKGANHLYSRLKECLAGKEFRSGMNIPFNQQFAKFYRFRRQLSNQLLDLFNYELALYRWSPDAAPLDPEYWVSYTSLKALKAQQVEFSNLSALKDYLRAEAHRYMDYVAQYFQAVFPLEYRLLMSTREMAFDALDAAPEVRFTQRDRVTELLQDCLAQAKSDLEFDERPRALFARWRKMKKLSYLKLPRRFKPTPVLPPVK
jgi:hypothetical protein